MKYWGRLPVLVLMLPMVIVVVVVVVEAVTEVQCPHCSSTVVTFDPSVVWAGAISLSLSFGVPRSALNTLHYSAHALQQAEGERIELPGCRDNASTADVQHRAQTVHIIRPSEECRQRRFDGVHPYGQKQSLITSLSLFLFLAHRPIGSSSLGSSRIHLESALGERRTLLHFSAAAAVCWLTIVFFSPTRYTAFCLRLPLLLFPLSHSLVPQLTPD